MSAPLAQATAVSRRFGSIQAVDAVDLCVEVGEVVGIVGANGAGKTTLIRLLLGLLGVSGGEVLLFGEPPSLRGRARLGYVPQSLGLYEDLTPAENLAFSSSLFGIGRSGLPPTLDGFATTLVGELPLGVQRRVAFIQALSHHPELLILDEPTSGVDVLARARLWQTIRDAADEGVGVLVTTHHMDEAAECDRLVVMAEGRVVAQGTVAAIVGDARVTVVEAQSWSEAFEAVTAAGMTAALVGRSLRILDVSPSDVLVALGPLAGSVREAPATLEERFVQLSSVP